MKSAGVVLLGSVSTGFSLSHYNEWIAALTGTLTFAIIAMKFWRSFRKTYLELEPPKKKQQEPKEETTIV